MSRHLATPADENKDLEEFHSSVLVELNKMLEHLEQMHDGALYEIKEKVMAMHFDAKLKFGNENYCFNWDGLSPSQLQEQLQSDTQYLVAQINKEKARLAILLMSYRQQNFKKGSTKRRRNRTISPKREHVDGSTNGPVVEFMKSKCINETLIEKLRKHITKSFKLGHCEIMEKELDIKKIAARLEFTS